MPSIEITGVGSELQGVGRLPDGRVVFVPGAIPGETVECRIASDRGRFCEASLVAVPSASQDRVTPACPHAGECGGCQARHMAYARTLALKRQRVFDALERIGGIDHPEVRDALGCANPDRTRNKAEYPIAAQGDTFSIGAFTRGSHRVLPLSDCLLQSEISVRALRWFSENLARIPTARHLKYLVTRVNRIGELMLILSGDAPIQRDLEPYAPVLRGALPELRSLWYCQLRRRPAHALDGACTRIAGDGTLRDRLLDLEFEISPQAFFQVNALQAEVLYNAALDAAGIRPGCGMRVLDAYCGAGTITLAAARWADSAVGIEIVPPAIENAKRNAHINGLQEKVQFICADAAREIPKLLDRGNRFDAAILDPPRKGAGASLLEALVCARIPVISYVSCDPGTLARDVKALVAGGYHLKWAQPVDMFPWTGHVETVCLMSRVEGK